MTGRKMGARLLDALETIVDPQRLARGRAIARSGAVTVIDRRQGWSMARVRGTQLQPFTAGVRLRPLTAEESTAVRAAVTAAPGVLTAVAAGRLPAELQDLLLPGDGGDLGTECDCPDRVPICRHVAGLLHTVAAAVDDDPVQLLALRGYPLTRLVDAVAAPTGTRRGPGADDGDDDEHGDPFTPATGLPPPPDPADSPRRGAADLLDPARWRTAVAAAGGDRAGAAAELDRLYRTLRGGAGQWDGTDTRPADAR